MEHKSVNFDDIKEAHNPSESKEGESSYDEYESDYDSSDCSITSRAITSFSDAPAVDAATLQGDESANTVWTDDKHSSYLDSIEATFVRKMYGKEYCSLDVCGRSSQSSSSRELECIESHPHCLNLRKPREQPVAPLPFRDITRPCSSVLASPWIQHFKAKQVVSSKNSEAQGNTTKAEAPNLSASTGNSQKPTSTMHDTISNTVPLKSNRWKRAGLFDSSDCMQFEVNSRSSHGTIAGGFKKLKCQQALSQMDMVMEEQYNKEQQNQENSHIDQQNEVPSDVTKEEIRTPQTCVFEAAESKKSTEVPQPMVLKEKQTKAVCMEMGLGTNMLSTAFLLKTSDQVVPSFKDCCKEEGEQSIIQDKAMPSKEVDDMRRPAGDNVAYMAEEVSLSLHSSEQENTSSQLAGSKTWTWGTQGIRYRLGGMRLPVNFEY